MEAVVRFWTAVLSLVVSVAAVGYLFFSFLFPERALVFETIEVRLTVMFVGLIATGTLVWSTVLVDNTEPATSPYEQDRNQRDYGRNRNR